LKQEQQPASEEVTEVAPGVLRLQLPIELPGLRHVNTYLLEDDRGVALVDPGLPGEESWTALGARLDAAGVPLRRVHTVFVTHSHPDHFGAAGLLAETSGARIVASETFKTWFDAFDVQGDAVDDELDDTDPNLPWNLRAPWGSPLDDTVPQHRRAVMDRFRQALAWFRPPHPSLRLADEDPIVLAGREWFALFTPGHTEDHLCLWDPTEGVLLSGDHVLPTITPHISGLVEGDPLARYVESLDRVAALPDVTVVLPAHGHPLTDLPGRVEAIKAHHEDRLEVLGRLSDAEGWASVPTLARRLFAERNWGPMAESETYAHLEHLRRRGRADRRETAGLLEYRVR
jgi:glyoxylase-like metal-dependent hydrolase (beta-lactamase superfamily II)